MQTPDHKSNITAEEFARLSGISVATVRRHAREWGARKLPGSRRWLFTARQVERLLGDGCEVA